MEKNFWLEAKMKGLCPKCGEYQWPMNTETILTQGDPMCACNKDMVLLDVYYDYQYMQGETLEVLFDKLNWYKTQKENLLEGSFIARILTPDKQIATLVPFELGAKGGNLVVNNENEEYCVHCAYIDYKYGTLVINWKDKIPSNFVVIANYEYKYEKLLA